MHLFLRFDVQEGVGMTKERKFFLIAICDLIERGVTMKHKKLHKGLKNLQDSISNQTRLPAELKHINKRRKRN